jgi:hypothetical protein
MLPFFTRGNQACVLTTANTLTLSNLFPFQEDILLSVLSLPL